MAPTGELEPTAAYLVEQALEWASHRLPLQHVSMLAVSFWPTGTKPGPCANLKIVRSAPENSTSRRSQQHHTGAVSNDPHPRQDPLFGDRLKGKSEAKHCVRKNQKVNTLTTAVFHQLHTGQKGSDGGMLCVGVNADCCLSLCAQGIGTTINMSRMELVSKTLCKEAGGPCTMQN